MRKLNADDLLNAIALSDKFDMYEVIGNLSFSEKGNIEKMGFNGVLALFRQATTEEMRVELFTFLAAPLEITVQEVRETPLSQLAKSIMEIADIEEWKELFTYPLDLK